MKRVFGIVLIGLLVVSCGGSSSGRLKVDIGKALKSKVRAQDLYTQADSIPLRCPVGATLLDVAADRFFLLDKVQNAILVLDWNGKYVTTISEADTIIDFSVYQDRILDVLTENAITEYAVTDGAFLVKYLIQDNDVMLKSVARATEDGIFIMGTLDGYAYDCDFLISKNRFYSGPRPASNYLSTHSYLPASEFQNSRFFRCKGIVYSFCSQSGLIGQFTDDYFICVPYEWDFGKWKLSITNVQKTADRFYLAFELEDEKYVLIYDLAHKKYRAVQHSAFPLGIIYADTNYSLTKDGDSLVMVRYKL